MRYTKSICASIHICNDTRDVTWHCITLRSRSRSKLRLKSRLYIYVWHLHVHLHLHLCLPYVALHYTLHWCFWLFLQGCSAPSDRTWRKTSCVAAMFKVSRWIFVEFKCFKNNSKPAKFNENPVQNHDIPSKYHVF